ncbi:MAG TPA: HAMP domain-containing sensor histidine kinase [Kofleriaceae bacterium]|nr:HAMP domain-containing sensor histidine kinase [Kofleriaceae bacterium]
MKPVVRRALSGVFPVAAVLASAVGIAYLGTVSYLADRGMVAAKAEEHARLARRVADALLGELRLALEAACAAFEAQATAPDPPPREASDRAAGDRAGAGDGGDREPHASAPALALAAAHPVAHSPFFLEPGGRLLHPPAELGTGAVDSAPDQEFMALLSRGPRVSPRRAAQLDAARRKEIGICRAESGPCRPTTRDLWEARRAYAELARHRDTGPEALLGLARLERAADRPSQAAATYRELERRFPDRVDAEGMPYALLAALGLGEVTGEAAPLLSALERVASGELTLPGALRRFLIDHLRAGLRSARMSPAEEQALAALDKELAAARDAGRLAARLADDVIALARTAGPEARGRPAFGAPERALVYRRLPGGGVAGLALERRDLDQLADRAMPSRERELGVSAVVLPIGEGPDERAERTLASVSLGPLLPHLGLVLVQDRSRPDPVAEMVRERGRRHLALTGGLVAVLVLGLVATIRGAARERELARLKSDFVSTVSHELKTPLTSIRMFAEMLQQGVAGEDRERERRYHEIIVKESERLGLLIANLLDYAQIERGTRRYDRQEQRAAAIAREAVTTFARLREGEGQEVELAVPEAAEQATVLVDREVTVQALLNLLSNATKYGGSGQPVEVGLARRAGGQVALWVRDRGPGIPASEQERIFREFYRSPAAYSAGVEGTGLGLALVKRHVEAQGGAIELDSAPGRGATFTLLFPEAPPEASAPGDGQAAA